MFCLKNSAIQNCLWKSEVLSSIIPYYYKLWTFWLWIQYCCRCDRGRPIKVPPVESYIMVLQPQQPSIEINGTANLARDYQDFRNGVRVFTDLHISVQPAGKLWKHGNCNLVIIYTIFDSFVDYCLSQIKFRKLPPIQKFRREFPSIQSRLACCSSRYL